MVRLGGALVVVLAIGVATLSPAPTHSARAQTLGPRAGMPTWTNAGSASTPSRALSMARYTRALSGSAMPSPVSAAAGQPCAGVKRCLKIPASWVKQAGKTRGIPFIALNRAIAKPKAGTIVEVNAGTRTPKGFAGEVVAFGTKGRTSVILAAPPLPEAQRSPSCVGDASGANGGC